MSAYFLEEGLSKRDEAIIPLGIQLYQSLQGAEYPNKAA